MIPMYIVDNSYYPLSSHCYMSREPSSYVLAEILLLDIRMYNGRRGREKLDALLFCALGPCRAVAARPSQRQ